jgi:hypothetical protein
LQHILKDSRFSGEVDRLGFPFIILYVPALTPQIHCSKAALQFAQNKMFVCCEDTGIVYKQSKRSSSCRGSIVYTYTDCNIEAMMELRGTLSATSLGIENSPSTKTINFLLGRDEAINLMRLIKNSHKLYRSECHVLSKRFGDIYGYSSRQNTTAEILGDVIRQLHTLKCPVMIYSKAKPTFISKFLSSMGL